MWGTELWASSNISNMIIMGGAATSLGFALREISLTGYAPTAGLFWECIIEIFG